MPPQSERMFVMANGKVDFFNNTGGYGFISTDDSDDDVFFHMEDVGGPDLEEGQDIDFDIEQAPKGPPCDERRPQLTRGSTSPHGDDRRLVSFGTTLPRRATRQF
ncbi:cold-shock DNA-binding domain protein domain protein [Halorubrum sp. AJ67]|nr:cold-shock DNA-binding domain protein domain protein [Halorubrum sp. AJ67]